MNLAARLATATPKTSGRAIVCSQSFFEAVGNGARGMVSFSALVMANVKGIGVMPTFEAVAPSSLSSLPTPLVTGAQEKAECMSEDGASLPGSVGLPGSIAVRERWASNTSATTLPTQGGSVARSSSIESLSLSVRTRGTRRRGQVMFAAQRAGSAAASDSLILNDMDPLALANDLEDDDVEDLASSIMSQRTHRGPGVASVGLLEMGALADPRRKPLAHSRKPRYISAGRSGADSSRAYHDHVPKTDTPGKPARILGRFNKEFISRKLEDDFVGYSMTEGWEVQRATSGSMALSCIVALIVEVLIEAKPVAIGLYIAAVMLNLGIAGALPGQPLSLVRSWGVARALSYASVALSFFAFDFGLYTSKEYDGTIRIDFMALAFFAFQPIASFVLPSRCKYLFYLYVCGCLSYAGLLFARKDQTKLVPKASAVLFVLGGGATSILFRFQYEANIRRKYLLIRASQASLAKSEAQRARAEILLGSCLPKVIADAIRDDPSVAIEDTKVDMCSVIVCDVVDFTPLASRLSASELVVMLKALFTAFEQCAVATGCEPLKTLGDCYMIVAGAPVAARDHAERAARCAALMLEAVEGYNAGRPGHIVAPLQVRIGVGSGGAQGGVIGTIKIAYDLWGDAVDRARAGEKFAPSNKALFSEETLALLDSSSSFSFPSRVCVERLGTFAVISLR